LRDFAGSHTLRASDNERAENRKARVMGERAQDAYYKV